MQNDKYSVLGKIFGHLKFRPLQEKAVDAILSGRDLLMILPTGGGKSLCYQLPAIMKDGCAVVISPLLALMHDQVQALKVQGVEAEMITSMQTFQEIGEVMQKFRSGKLKLLYIAPERLKANGFIDLLKDVGVSFFVIDEAHCVSEWGHEFREDYRKLNILKKIFPSTPIAAFTATATKKVELDIAHHLGLKDPLRLRGHVYRENLNIKAQVRIKDGRTQLLRFLDDFKNESGIVYAFTRNQVESLASYLQSVGIKALAYHAGLSSDVRNEAYRAFVHDEVQVIVATIAFGMGIDKSNIRFVVHMSMPKTLENYYQEIGRAGRDGLASSTLLLYSAADAAQRAGLIEDIEDSAYRQNAFDKLERMVGYCRSESCRHQQLATYFDDHMSVCEEHCDNCMEAESEKYDITREAQMFLSAIYRTGQNFGKNHIIDLLRGSKSQKIEQLGHTRLSVYSIGKEHSKAWWETIVERLMELGALRRGEYRNLLIDAKGKDILKSKTKVFIKASRLEIADKKISRSKKEKQESAPISYEMKIFDTLRALRKEIADEDGVPAYIVFSDKTIKEMAATLPIDKEQMLRVNGVGEVKWERYGDRFTKLCEELKTQ